MCPNVINVMNVQSIIELNTLVTFVTLITFSSNPNPFQYQLHRPVASSLRRNHFIGISLGSRNTKDLMIWKFEDVLRLNHKVRKEEKKNTKKQATLLTPLREIEIVFENFYPRQS